MCETIENILEASYHESTRPYWWTSEHERVVRECYDKARAWDGLLEYVLLYRDAEGNIEKRAGRRSEAGMCIRRVLSEMFRLLGREREIHIDLAVLGRDKTGITITDAAGNVVKSIPDLVEWARGREG